MRNAGCSLRGTPSAMGIHKVQAVIGKTHNAGLQEAQGQGNKIWLQFHIKAWAFFKASYSFKHMLKP